MIVVPYPHAGGHQRHNAAPYAAAGAALLIDDADCTPERIGTEISALVADPTRWHAMSAASAALGLPDATDAVVRLTSSQRGRPGARPPDDACARARYLRVRHLRGGNPRARPRDRVTGLTTMRIRR